jgi:hypothetical protein
LFRTFDLPIIFFLSLFPCQSLVTTDNVSHPPVSSPWSSKLLWGLFSPWLTHRHSSSPASISSIKPPKSTFYLFIIYIRSSSKTDLKYFSIKDKQKTIMMNKKIKTFFLKRRWQSNSNLTYYLKTSSISVFIHKSSRNWSSLCGCLSVTFPFQNVASRITRHGSEGLFLSSYCLHLAPPCSAGPILQPHPRLPVLASLCDHPASDLHPGFSSLLGMPHPQLKCVYRPSKPRGYYSSFSDMNLFSSLVHTMDPVLEKWF